MSRASGSRPPAAESGGGGRLAVLASHFSQSSRVAREKEAALVAVPSDGPTIFDKIVRRDIPSQVVYEDEKTLAFRDISPQAPVHIIIIPKVKDGLSRLSKAEERHIEVMGRLLYAAKIIAKQENLADGFRIVINDGPNGCEHQPDSIETYLIGISWTDFVLLFRSVCISPPYPSSRGLSDEMASWYKIATHPHQTTNALHTIPTTKTLLPHIESPSHSPFLLLAPAAAAELCAAPPLPIAMASMAFTAAKFLPATAPTHLDSSSRFSPPPRAGTLSFSPLSSSSSSSSALLRLRSPSPSGPGGRLPPPPPPRSYGGGGSGDAADSGGGDEGRRGGILGIFLAGWAARVAADPQFPFKVLMEELVGVSACVLGDMASRPNFGLNELDFVFSTLVVGSILNFVLMYLLAPTAGASAAVSSGLPSHMFEAGAYSLGSRVATLVSKGATFAAVGFAAGLAGTAISNGLISLRKRMDPAFETPNKAPPTLLNAATWAIHMGVSSNLRYQTLNGVEYLLAKAAPPSVFKVSVVALRCMNNVLGGMSFVLLARLTGSQKSDKPAASAIVEEKESLIAEGNAVAGHVVGAGRDGDGK
uniref:HIT domain-containing protein n=1 Tax=Leersia perrieri TaxID=77586 RepID=A0A0D9V706_9ORYZ